MADEKEANAEPAAFLLTLQDECPSITKLLNQKQLQFLETSPHLAYGKDSENINVEFCKDLSSFYIVIVIIIIKVTPSAQGWYKWRTRTHMYMK